MARPTAARWSRLALAGAFSILVGMLGVPGANGYPANDGVPLMDATSTNFQLVGHTPLGNRGMNAALAVHGNYAYVGSRTDGKPWNTDLNLNHAGIMVVDISNPASPTVVGEIGPPNQGLTDQTSREMRIWPQHDLLIVENLQSNCSELIHACYPGGAASAVRPDVFTFYDISGANAAAPKKILDFDPPANPHEFFLWVDPFNPDRALFFVGPGGSSRLQVYDISPVLQGQQPVPLVVSGGTPGVPSGIPGALHSLSVSTDGTRAYYAHLTGGFAVADTSDVANGGPDPSVRLITPAAKRVSWPGPGAHSAVKLFGQDYALVSDEVYGESLSAAQGQDHGCPWGWVRMIDISDPKAPKVAAEYKLAQNQASFCGPVDTGLVSSFASHNPTLTPHIAFITWHSGGFQAIDISNPAAPTSAGAFVPDPLPYVVQEDPALSSGADKVVMWSYPIIKDGLIYVTDIRNGLYILRYTGPHAEEVDSIDFLEGNSNLGDALKFDPPDPCLRTPPPPGTICP